jgi:hypothetical protein
MDYHGKEYSEKIKKNPLEEALNYAKCVSTIKYTNKDNVIENKLFGKAFEQAIDVFIHFKKPLLVLRLLNKLVHTSFSVFSIHFATLKATLYCNLELIQLNNILKSLRVTISRKNSLSNSSIKPSLEDHWENSIKLKPTNGVRLPKQSLNILLRLKV